MCLKYISDKTSYFMNTFFDVIKTKLYDSIYIFRKQGIFYDPDSILKNSSVAENKLKVMSYNIDNHAFHKLKYSTPDINRAVDIINYLQSIEFDIICLQGVWGETMKQEIYDAFISENYYIALPNYKKNFVLGENSGLMLISKYPMITQTFLPFKNSKVMCSFINKGVQYCHITVPVKNSENVIVEYPLNIANTHLQSSLTNISGYLDFSKTAKNQLQYIIDECPFNNCILAGDINLTKSQMDRFIKDQKNKQLTYFGINESNTHKNEKERLNYFLCIAKTPYTMTHSTENTTASEIDLSDHYPIISNVSFFSNINNID